MSTKVDDYPSVTYPDIVSYLIFSPSPYSSDDLKSYKSLDAYNQFQEGWVSDVKVKMAKDDIVVVGARVSNFSNVAPKAQTDQYPSLKQVVDNRGGIVHFFIMWISFLINGRGSSEIKNQTWFASF